MAMLVVAGLLGSGVLVGITPSVDDAEGRVAAITAAHHVPHRQEEVPARFAAALVATEDARFYSHHGIDSRGVLRAAVAAVTGGSEDPGGSTLDQQLGKQLYFDGQHGGIVMTVEQVAVAVKLDARYSKAQILAMYASVVYFGHGYYGLDAASRGYFGLSAEQLSWGQAAMLAGLVQAPSDYDPLIHHGLARERQRHVLARLVDTGQLTPAQADAAAAAPLHLAASP